MKTGSVTSLTKSPIFWGAVILLAVLVLLMRGTRAEGLTSAKKDVKITKGLPSNVSYVVKKANGETKVVLKSGKVNRYAKGDLPSFMKKIAATTKKDVKITEGLPSNVDYVVKKANGETKVVYTSGKIERYAKGDTPSFMKKKKPATNPATKPKKDVTITNGLPSNVAYVVKKANGETVVVNNDGTQDRYGVGKLPSFMKKTATDNKPNKPKRQTRDVTITKNLPADVKYVVKKANGETVVVKKNGQIQRYPKNKLPSFLKQSKPSSGGNNGDKTRRQPANVKEIGKAIANVQKRLDGINAALKVVQTNQKDKRILEQVRDILDQRLSKLKETEQQCYSGMYIDKGDVWVLE